MNTFQLKMLELKEILVGFIQSGPILQNRKWRDRGNQQMIQLITARARIRLPISILLGLCGKSCALQYLHTLKCLPYFNGTEFSAEDI